MDVFIYMINISKSWSNKNYLWQWPKQECRTFLSFQFLTFWQFFEDCLDLEHFTWIHPYGNKLFHCLQIRKKISRAWLNKIAQIVDILNWPFILRKLAFSRVEKNVLAVLVKGFSTLIFGPLLSFDNLQWFTWEWFYGRQEKSGGTHPHFDCESRGHLRKGSNHLLQ